MNLFPKKFIIEGQVVGEIDSEIHGGIIPPQITNGSTDNPNNTRAEMDKSIGDRSTHVAPTHDGMATNMNKANPNNPPTVGRRSARLRYKY